MRDEMDESFTAALRELLIEQVSAEGRARSRVRRPGRWSASLGLLATLLAGASGIAAAAVVVISSTLPGSQRVTALSAPLTVGGAGTQTVQLNQRPPGANAIYFELSCLTPGTFTFADGAGLTCNDQADVADTLEHPATGTIVLGAGDADATITAAHGDRWRLTLFYASATTTPWKINGSGQTYGTPNPNGVPDLVAAIATNGQSGYVYASQLDGPQPTTPTEAATWSPAPRTITVYESDGKTPIGHFVVGR